MSNEIEKSLDIPASGRVQRLRGYVRNDKTQLGMRPLFAHLNVYQDERPRSATKNMGIDEALLEEAGVPTIRFYRWRSPALSFGYFGKFSDVIGCAAARELVRRWTGGGIVFHGDDLTYSIVIPATDPAFEESSIAIYEKIHRALVDALNGFGECAVVSGIINPGPIRMRAGVTASGHNCFANPVRADVMMNDRKIAGAAQRRTRRGLLQQGSIQGFAMDAQLAEKFAQALSTTRSACGLNDRILQRAKELAGTKYGTNSWLMKR